MQMMFFISFCYSFDDSILTLFWLNNSEKKLKCMDE